jgi:hypothetical protein
MPPWTTIEADADVVCNLHQRLADVYPVNSIDVVLVGIFHQVRDPWTPWGGEWLMGGGVTDALPAWGGGGGLDRTDVWAHGELK